MGCLAFIGGLCLFCFLYTIHPVFALLFIVFMIGVWVGKKR